MFAATTTFGIIEKMFLEVVLVTVKQLKMSLNII